MKCLIAGQGIAGTVLAWILLRKGVEVQVFDPGFHPQASAEAAGIINPVTGKRYVKTWRFDALFPFAFRTYQAMELDLGCKIWNEQPILRLLAGPQEINDWSARIGYPGYENLLGERADKGDWAPLLRPGFHAGEIRQAVRVDFSALLNAARDKWRAENRFSPHQISPELATERAKSVDYIIYCEGYRGYQNPFFPGLAWQLSKGEGMIIRIDDPRAASIAEMVKRDIILVPLGAGTFWIGASYNWTFEDDGASAPEQQLLEQRLAGILNVPYTVVRRFGAIRPTVKDRRPFLGRSPVHPQMFIFNGLGTKGALLAPYWANHLAEHLLEGKILDAEVDIQRFFSKT